MSEEKLELPEQNYGPGKLLRAKREEYEWSIEAVAEALHLSTHSVKAIESDRYDELPGATYVIGYWRSYARLLGIDIDDTIEASKQNLNIVTGEAAGVDVHRSQDRKKGSGGRVWLLLLIALAGFGYYAWQQQFFGLLGDQLPFLQQEPAEPVPAGGETGQESEAVETPPVEQVLRPLDTDSDSDAQAEPEIPSSGMPSQVVTEPPVSEKPEPTAPAPSTQPTGLVPAVSGQSGLVMVGSATTPDAVDPDKQSSSETETDLAPIPESAPKVATTTNGAVPAGETVSAQGDAPAVSQPVPAADDASTMLVKLSKDSWLDIRDKTNTRLVYTTESAGKELTVKGAPPFYIYIGTPDGVSIHYQGRDVPFETHKSGLFARFKLGDGILESL